MNDNSEITLDRIYLKQKDTVLYEFYIKTNSFSMDILNITAVDLKGFKHIIEKPINDYYEVIKNYPMKDSLEYLINIWFDIEIKRNPTTKIEFISSKLQKYTDFIINNDGILLIE